MLPPLYLAAKIIYFHFNKCINTRKKKLMAFYGNHFCSKFNKHKKGPKHTENDDLTLVLF